MDYAPFISDLVIEPGLKALLGVLKPAYRLAVATNRSNTIGEVLDTFGLAEFFEIVVSSLDVQNPKPHPDAILKILEFFEISPKKAIYVGDTEVDAAVSRVSGVPFIAYKNNRLKADWHARSMEDVRKILEA
jgi:phosphoglycolate phosphatase-like HAD superfamily hydrolase